jgi:hypothetical protein
VDEGPSGRAPSGMALRDRQTGWQGSLGWKNNFPGCFQLLSHQRLRILTGSVR